MNERRVFGKITGEVAFSSMRYEIRSPENFGIARDHLQHGSLLLYSNHFTKFDVTMFGRVIRDYFGGLNHAASFAAMKHVDPDRSIEGKFLTFLFATWEQAFGLQTIPLIQTTDTYPYVNRNRFNRNALRRAIDFLQMPGHVLTLAPEGTRSKIGQLLKAEDALEALFRLGGDTILAMPLAAEHTRIIPVLTNTRVIAGKPFSYREIQAEHEQNPDIPTSDLMMKRLANLLPEQNRGAYR